ncbi:MULTISPECIES: Acg family FMN-binding oxidoreductase [unclassified Streptomyces]|uniref:Acg family FMN-binding oxidoreductase n=1 Tax=unclassified Streptomyces TaxID=2593676 RepID=UPI002DDBDDBD|nr:nitroreductase family protein [Streptomyces sp. NBC_01750]WSA98619.1 nitroreductase family protein [Streptomyces sp. NBC_01794]WSD36846.1 nitroreductase family protein [Streptomyces sp. NBC_01750]
MSVHALDTKTVTALVKDATAAPSMHNAQPWKFRFFHASNTFHVCSDLERAMPRADPTTRALHLGCAAAMLNLRVAAAHAGWEPATELLPDPADPQLLATIRLTSPATDENDLAPLYPAIRRRHTSRHPFADEEIPQPIKDALSAAALLEGAQLTFPNAWYAQSLLDLVHDAEGRDAMDPAASEELRRWTRVGAGVADAASDGIPEYAFGPRKRDGKAPVRDFAGRRTVPGRDAAVFENAPQLALLGTVDDRPRDWLLAGQAMERVLLQATLDGLSASLTSNALEWPELRWAVRDPQSAMGFVQMVLRLGYGPSGSETPRRPVYEVLDIE